VVGKRGKRYLMELEEVADKPLKRAGSTKLFSLKTIPAASWKTQHCSQTASLLLELVGEEAAVGADLAGNRALRGRSTKLFYQLTTW